MSSLVVPANVEKYEKIYRSGYNKKYPNLDLVRLEAWYFGRKPGRVLDFGCGTGTNMLHLLENGYEVVGVDAAVEAVQLVRERLSQRPELADRGSVQCLEPNDSQLGFLTETFDYVVCMSVLSLLETKERIANLIAEFRRILRSGGRMIIDVNGPGSDFAEKGRFVGRDIFEYTLRPDDNTPLRCYCPQTANDFAELLSGFIVDDVGYSSFRYQGHESFEFIACARKPL